MADGWTFTKRHVEQYQFNGPHGMWAIITLDPRGIFQAISDVGDYAYDGWWGHGCESFKHFLARGLDRDYFLGKTAARERRFSLEKTKDRVRRDVLEARRSGYITKDAAREAWDELACRDEDNATLFIERSQEVQRIVYGSDPTAMCEVCVEEWSGCATRFYEEVFRAQLVPALRAELGLAAPDQEAAHA